MVSKARKRGLRAPLLLMGYYNPLLSYGEERLLNDCRAAGVNGFIVVDLPPQEAVVFRNFCAKGGYVTHHTSPSNIRHANEKLYTGCHTSHSSLLVSPSQPISLSFQWFVSNTVFQPLPRIVSNYSANLQTHSSMWSHVWALRVQQVLLVLVYHSY